MNSMYYLLLYLFMENELDVYDTTVLFILTTYLYSTILQNRNYITTAGLQKPSLTSRQYLYLHGTDSNYMSAIGINHITFNYLLYHFSDFYIVLSGPGQPGRPSRLFSKSTILVCL